MKKLVVALLAAVVVVAFATGAWAHSSFTDSEIVAYKVKIADVLFIDIKAGDTTHKDLDVGTRDEIVQGHVDLLYGNTIRCWSMSTYRVGLTVTGSYIPYDAPHPLPQAVPYWFCARISSKNYWDGVDIVGSTPPTTGGYLDYAVSYRFYLKRGGNVLDLDDGDVFWATYTFTMYDL